MGREVKTNITVTRLRALRGVAAAIFAGVILVGISRPAAASYLPFNTSVNMNVGIGTSTPQGAFVVTNGNVGIGTWAPDALLTVVDPFPFTDIDAFDIYSNGSPVFTVNPYLNTVTMLGGSATENDSIAMGQYTGASGIASLATGIQTTAAGNYSTAMGNSSQANGDYSIAMGQVAVASGEDSTAIGLRTTASSYGSIVIGAFNYDPGNYTAGSWVTTEPLFIIGNGTGFGVKSTNAVTVLKNGNVGLGTYIPASLLDIVGNVGIGTGISSPYVNTSAPSGGMIVQGNVGIGSLSPGQALDVNGTMRMTGFTLTGNGAGNGNVLVGNSVGVGTWMPASALGISGGSGTNYWLNDITGNVGISTTYAVGIGTTFVGGTNEAALSVMNGNVGIGTWLPKVSLDVEGNITAENANVRAGGFGNFASTDTIVFNDGSSGVNVETNSLSRMYVTLAGNVGIGTITPAGGLVVMNGNVGIGTVAPNQALYVNGNMIINSAIYSANQLAYFSLQSNNELLIAPNITLSNSSDTDAAINLVGSVAIGTVNYQNTLPDGALIIEPTAGNVGIGTWTADGGNLIVNGGGNVGVSTAWPGQALDVHGTVRMTGLTLTGNGAASGNVLVSNSVGIGTWMSASALSTLVGSNYWLNDTAGNVGISTTYAVGIGTTFVGGTGEAALSVMNGNVGIGTWVPVVPLHVISNGADVALFQNNNPADDSDIGFKDNTGTSKLWLGYGNASSGAPYAGISFLEFDSPNFAIYNNNGAVLNEYFTSSGNVGVGTFAVSDTFQVGNYSSSRSGFEVDINGNVGIGTTLTSTAAISIMNGNVGIGTWIPNSLLEVIGTVPAGGTGITIENKSNTGFTGLGFQNSSGGSTGVIGYANSGWSVDPAETGNLFIETFTGNLMLDASNSVDLQAEGGNVGVGSVTPGQILDVQGTVRSIGLTMSGQTPISGYVLTAQDSAGDATWSSPGTVSGWTTSGNNVYETSNGNVGIGTINPFGGNLIVNGGGNVGIGTLVPGQLLDVKGTARMTGFTLSGNGAANGDILVGNSVGVGTWMSTSTLTAGLLNTGTINQVAYYSGTTALSGNSNMVFVPASGNVGLGTVTPLATLQIIGNVGIGTVKNGDAFITTSPPSGGMIVEGNVGIGTPTTASLLQLGPGTSSKPSITLATGTIGAGGTGIAGAIEFDGTAFYDTAAPSSRQVIDSEQFVALTNNFTLVNGSSAQPAFGGTGAPANGTLTVVPHTTYLFEALYLISNGTTTHETAVGFGGTATISAVDYSSYIWSVNANTPTTAQTFEWIQSAAITNCNSTQSASNSTAIVLKGIIRIGASSGTNTIIPEIAFGHIPGGTNTMNNDSYFRIYPLGSDTTVYQGDWS